MSDGAATVLHEAGHVAQYTQRISQEDAAAWLRATGWDGGYDDAMGVFTNTEKYYKPKPYEYIGPNEYGTFHPMEAWAETYRIKYGGDIPSFLDDLDQFPEAKADLLNLMSAILDK